MLKKLIIAGRCTKENGAESAIPKEIPNLCSRQPIFKSNCYYKSTTVYTTPVHLSNIKKPTVFVLHPLSNVPDVKCNILLI